MTDVAWPSRPLRRRRMRLALGLASPALWGTACWAWADRCCAAPACPASAAPPAGRGALLRGTIAPAACAAAADAALAQGGEECRRRAVCKSEAEWARTLSPQQFFVLRSAGTEAPRSSPLLRERRQGRYRCAGCAAFLFESSSKVASQSPWLSFGSALPTVEVEGSWFEAVTGAKLRCARCGGHLGERFLDGASFAGTPAARTGRRYCVNGAALVFVPADGLEPVAGQNPAADSVEYWEKYPWRMIDGGLRPI
ncbi:unnamed protein product [Prorocentrum cordatum]|uniref:MsrB domain-containing protein n=1 Tax=Prorocentrum cordatum TaxID=2364126 RepID=A0ABN9SN59_9DINO|nr:unnamed protein product [Polarella glacialis]